MNASRPMPETLTAPAEVLAQSEDGRFHVEITAEVEAPVERTMAHEAPPPLEVAAEVPPRAPHRTLLDTPWEGPGDEAATFDTPPPVPSSPRASVSPISPRRPVAVNAAHRIELGLQGRPAA